jgi:hypothetical protein
MYQKVKKKIFTFVERPQLTTIALKEGLLVIQLLRLFQDVHIMDRYLKFEHGMKAVMVVPWKEMYKDMQKEAK